MFSEIFIKWNLKTAIYPNSTGCKFSSNVLANILIAYFLSDCIDIRGLTYSLHALSKAEGSNSRDSDDETYNTTEQETASYHINRLQQILLRSLWFQKRFIHSRNQFVELNLPSSHFRDLLATVTAEYHSHYFILRPLYS